MKNLIKRLIISIVEKVFPEPELKGTPVDFSPGLRIGKVIEPEERLSFNDVFANANKEVTKAVLKK